MRFPTLLAVLLLAPAAFAEAPDGFLYDGATMGAGHLALAGQAGGGIDVFERSLSFAAGLAEDLQLGASFRSVSPTTISAVGFNCPSSTKPCGEFSTRNLGVLSLRFALRRFETGDGALALDLSSGAGIWQRTVVGSNVVASLGLGLRYGATPLSVRWLRLFSAVSYERLFIVPAPDLPAGTTPLLLDLGIELSAKLGKLLTVHPALGTRCSVYPGAMGALLPSFGFFAALALETV